MEMIDEYGRIYDCREYTKDELKDWLKRPHSAGEVVERLRLNRGSQDFDQTNVTDEDKDFSAKEFENARVFSSTPVTIFEKDKLKDIANSLKQLEDDNK